MRAFQGTFAVDIWSIKCCVVDIWSIFGFFFWWSIFDKTPVAGLLLVGLEIINLSDEPITISQTLPTIL